MQQPPIVPTANTPILLGFDWGAGDLSALYYVQMGNDIVVYDSRATGAKQAQAAGTGIESSPARQAWHGRSDTASNRDALDSSDIKADTRAE